MSSAGWPLIPKLVFCTRLSVFCLWMLRRRCCLCLVNQLGHGCIVLFVLGRSPCPVCKAQNLLFSNTLLPIYSVPYKHHLAAVWYNWSGHLVTLSDFSNWNFYRRNPLKQSGASNVKKKGSEPTKVSFWFVTLSKVNWINENRLIQLMRLCKTTGLMLWGHDLGGWIHSKQEPPQVFVSDCSYLCCTWIALSVSQQQHLMLEEGGMPKQMSSSGRSFEKRLLFSEQLRKHPEVKPNIGECMFLRWRWIWERCRVHE